MRHDGSSLGVTLGRLQSPLGQWSAVVGMNDIVSGGRMIRQLLEDALQHLSGLPLPGVGRVQGIGCREQGQRIEQRSLSVVRIAATSPPLCPCLSFRYTQGWETKPLGDLCRIEMGGTPPRAVSK